MRVRQIRLRPSTGLLLFALAAALPAPAARAQLGLATRGDSASLVPTMPFGFALEDVTGGAPFNQPTAVTFAPGGRMFVAEKDGVVWAVRNGVRQPLPLIDLNKEVLSNIERGLLGLAVDPSFDSNGYLYLVYTVDHDGSGDWDRTDAFGRVTRYTVTRGAQDFIDPASRHVILGDSFSVGIPSCHVSHAPAMVTFGSDGTMLIGTGDGATFGQMDPGGLYPNCFGPGRLDPSEDIGAFRAQRLQSLAGKILRVDPATGLGLPSNPYFTGDSTDNASRVWAYGVRNSFRFAIRDGGATDPDSARPGTIMAGDVGWGVWEELNVVRGGENMGWPCWEGPAPEPRYQAATPPTNGCQGMPQPTLPVAWWHHLSSGQSVPPGLRSRSIIGGDFALGPRYPEPFAGRYFFGDYVLGWMAAARFDDNDVLEDIILFSPNIGAVVQTIYDPLSRALYLVNIVSGRIERLRHASEENNQPPVVDVRAQPTSGFPPMTVQFSAAGTTDPDGDSLTVEWTFGDGWIGQGLDVEHTYLMNGDYNAVATIRDRFYVMRDTVVINVHGSAPVLQVSSPAEGAAALPGETVHLTAAAFDPDGSTVDVRWTITQVHNTHEHRDIFSADGPTALFTVPEHGAPGEVVYYRILVTASDGGSLVTAEERYLRVREPREVDVVPEGVLVARVMEPVGQGNPSLEVVRDGVRPPRGATDPLLQYDTNDGLGGGELDWVGLETAGVERFRRVEFQEGIESEFGGWFKDVIVEVRQDGVWVGPPVLHFLPPYRAPDGVTFDRYSIVFAETAGDAVRVIGSAGGTDRYMSVAELQAFALRESSLPVPWTTYAVGENVGGSARGEGEGIAVEAGGAFGPTNDAFRFVYSLLDGDGVLTARLAGVRGDGRAGLLIRTSLADTAAHAAFLADGETAAFRSRTASGGTAVETSVAVAGGAPVWLRLVRTGSIVTAFHSPDGQRWMPAGAASIEPGVRAYAGLGVAGGSAVFDGATLATGSSELPPPWELADVGSPTIAGGAAYVDGSFIVSGVTPPGGRSEPYSVLQQTAPGRGELTARLDAIAAAADGAEAGLVITGGLDPAAPYAEVLVRDDTLRMRFRAAPRGSTVEARGPAAPDPVWLRLEWANDAAVGWWSPDGVTWTVLEPAGVALGDAVHAGLTAAGVSSLRGVGAAGVFTEVMLDAGAGEDAVAGGSAMGAPIDFGVSIRPNPVRDRATLDVGVDRPGRVFVEVLDVLGRRVLEHAIEAAAPARYAIPVSTAGLPAGSYLARIVDGRGRQVVGRFVVAGR